MMRDARLDASKLCQRKEQKGEEGPIYRRAEDLEGEGEGDVRGRKGRSEKKEGGV